MTTNGTVPMTWPRYEAVALTNTVSSGVPVEAASRSRATRAARPLASVVSRELNAATDNPLVVDGGELLSGGNFHGQIVAQAMDLLAIALTDLASISERRIERLVNPDLSELPAFLTPEPGLRSGMMVAQIAAASLVSEAKVLAHPASVDSIPTGASKEDHVSMGMTAARKAARILRHAETVIGIELLCAAEGIDAHRPLKSGRGVERAHSIVRRLVPRVTQDRPLTPAIESLAAAIREGAFGLEIQHGVDRSRRRRRAGESR